LSCQAYTFFINKTRGKERLPLFLVLQTPSKSFKALLFTKGDCGK
jgi:hypothetical protein